ncbi:hypothetical protein [Deinococcus wulumuqiensis]|uniref:MFS transporter n=2 Tax=Deinococcus wulumuqiensis TaxID=980427 RepID=A0ABQ2PXC5_9DEIO|nr:hypothetical protein [Deinococcus wulumuqiensis]GGP30335.1 hypothetical protein GCM10008021_19860 [Deinococcus wulumuqiensis]
MGLNLALAMLPALLQPFLGAWVDRIPLKIPLVAGNVLRVLLQLGVGFWALRGHLPTEIIYAASFLIRIPIESGRFRFNPSGCE